MFELLLLLALRTSPYVQLGRIEIKPHTSDLLEELYFMFFKEK